MVLMFTLLTLTKQMPTDMSVLEPLLLFQLLSIKVVTRRSPVLVHPMSNEPYSILVMFSLVKNVDKIFKRYLFSL